jgi:uncharacterized protein YbjT (DUF2867 family)
MQYAISGITGKVGAEVAKILLEQGASVRGVMRDPSKVAPWAARGCSVALAEIGDASALTRAFSEADGVFVLLPSSFDPAPGFPEVKATLAAVRAALLAVRPSRVVCISTVGAQATTENLLSQLGIMEQTLGELPMPITFLRPAWFMENCAWDVAPARQAGVISSFLQPLDKPFPMVAIADVARVGARLLQETWSGRRVVELEGPTRVSPRDIGGAFSRLLGKNVGVQAVARETWAESFTAQGMKHPEPRMRMLDGFNEGWIEFEAGAGGSLKGTTTLDGVLQNLLNAGAKTDSPAA